MLFDKICGTKAEIEAEISECRQDERDSQNQILQVISTAATVLSVIFAASTFFSDETGNSSNTLVQQLFYLNVMVFCAAMPYITTLGIVNVLRFQYIRVLEDHLAKKTPYSAFLHWTSFNSPITTRNLWHIGSPITFFHFFCYNIATFSAILFCIILTVAQYSLIPEKNGLVIFFLCFELILVFTISILFFVTCLNAEKIANYAMKRAVENRKARLNGLKKDDISTFFRYILYPRSKDFHKGALIVSGYLIGTFLTSSTLSLIDLKNILIAWLVMEFLGYQARYQINDLRGLHEGENRRLPNPTRFASISAVSVLVKVLMALIMTILFGGKAKLSLAFCLVLLGAITVIYEYVRLINNSESKSIWSILILVFVSLGYPLRFVAGFLVAVPEFWMTSFKVDGYSLGLWEKVLILIAFAFFGEFSVLFPWYYEANEQQERQLIKKTYYHWLLEHEKLPIRELSLLCSILVLACLQLRFFTDHVVIYYEVCILFCTALLCVIKNDLCAAVLCCGVFAVTGLWKCNLLSLYQTSLEFPYIGCIFLIQIFFIATYMAMRIMFGPKINWRVELQKFSICCFYILAGKKSAEWIRKQIADRETDDSNVQM